jgi:hypothetical protein
VPAPALSELQRLFFERIAGAPPAPALLDVVEPSASLTADGRLGVYADAYFWRLHGVLREDFPKVAAVVGAAAMERLARDYVTAHPSAHPSARHFGERFAGFLAARADVPPYAADLALLEWARVEAFDAPDAPALTVADLRTVAPGDWPALRFVATPSLVVVRSPWPIHAAWSSPEAGVPGLVPTVVRVWRTADWRVLHGPMDALEDAALTRLIAGEPFAVLCETFGALPTDEAARETAALLARWVEDGLLAGVA